MKQLFCLFLLLHSLTSIARVVARPSEVNAGYDSNLGDGVDITESKDSEISPDVDTLNTTEIISATRLNNATHNTTGNVIGFHSNYTFQNLTKTAGGFHTNNATRNTVEIVREIDANNTVQNVTEIFRDIFLNNASHNITETVHSAGQNVTETVREVYFNNGTDNTTELVNGFRLNNGNRSTTEIGQNTSENALREFGKRLLELRAERYYSYTSGFSGLSCSSCSIFMEVVREFWSRPGITRALASHVVTSACISLRMQHPDVCIGIVREFKEEFYSIFGNGFSSRGICSVMLDQRCGDEDSLDKPWSVVFPKTRKPPVHEPSPAEPGLPVLKVLHLTDLHIDLNYQENTSSLCGEPLCCRESNGRGDAGYWGSYGCDIPLRTLESALKHIQLNHNDISYIILTGDIPPHDVWLETKSSQIKVMQRAFGKIKEYFPDKKVFVAVGNHDTHPTNSFPPPSVSSEFSIQWLLDSYADMWSAWLPNTSLHTVRKGGFFTALVSPGFRIVSINNNYCNKLNWWLLLNNTDPAGELQWLIQVLQDAEDNQEKVHIIAHIPTGSNFCYKYWSWNYYKIINRYENTVTAQFCGHTHQDHFEIFYDLIDHTRPTSVMYVAPSLTTNNAYQPAYRIYEVEDHNHSSRRVLDHKTYKLDLEKSNKDRKAYWELEYSAKDTYRMKSARPRDWDDLVTRMKNDDELFEKFYKFKYRYPKQKSCDKDCKRRELCALKTARSHDNTFCETTAEHVLF